MRGEGVEERVASRVVGLPRVAEHTGSRGEHDERRQVVGQLVQVPRGVSLGPHHLRDTFGRHRLDHAVVQHTGGVHDAPDLVLRKKFRDSVPVRHVTRGDGDLCSQRFQLRRVRLTTTADEQQLPDTVVLDEVPRDDRAQPTGTAGDENLALPPDIRLTRDPRQPSGEHLTVTNDQLRLVDTERHRHHRGGKAVAAQVDQPEPPGMLRLRRPHQTPHRRGAQVLARGHASRDERQPAALAAADPLLHQPQHPRGVAVRAGQDVLAAGHRHQHEPGIGVRDGVDHRVTEVEHVRPDHHDRLRRRDVVLRDRHPLEPEQLALPGLAELLDGDRPHHHGLDRGDRRARDVGQRDRPAHAALVTGQLDAQLARPGGVQRHALPRERQPGVERLVQQRRVQRRVEQRRMQPIRRAVDVLGQRELGVDLVADPPRGLEVLERVPVGEAHDREPLVALLVVHGHGAGRWPHRRFELTAGRPARQEPGRVLRPRRIGRVLRPRVDCILSTAAGFRADLQLHLHGPSLRQHERRGERQVVDPVEPDLVRGSHRELDQHGGRHQGASHDHVVREPRLRAQRQPAGEHHPFALGQLHRGPEQRMLHADQPEPGRVRCPPRARRPVPLPVERIGGQLDPPAALVEPRPVNIDSVNMYLTECSQH